ncbi:hypothetical protein V9K67_09475 [Paraflavisolibacter sp. H34]|uniref:hypothetical protein n=1 Tax=Huijunlia imazamoxiresistens TaxID=3127457 RepID=UPI00301AC757
MKTSLLLIAGFLPTLCMGQINRMDIDSFERIRSSKQIGVKQLKRDDSVIHRNLIGAWRDQNSSFTFDKKGIMTTYFDDPKESTRHKWTVKNRVLYLNPSGIEPGSLFAYKMKYFIIYSSPKDLEFRYIDKKADSTVWIARKQPLQKR